jgi:hypothetical protein
VEFQVITPEVQDTGTKVGYINILTRQSSTTSIGTTLTFLVDDFGEIIRLLSNVLTDNCLSGAFAIVCFLNKVI